MKRICICLAASAIAFTYAAPPGVIPGPAETPVVLRNLDVIDNASAGRITDGYVDISLGTIQPAKDGYLTITDAMIYNSEIRQPWSVLNADAQIPLNPGWVKITKRGTFLGQADRPFEMDGVEITIHSATAYPHIIQFPAKGLIDGSGKPKTQAVFSPHRGSSFTIFADGSEWIVKSSRNVTFQ